MGEGSPTKIDYRQKGTLILTFLLEDVVKEFPPRFLKQLKLTEAGCSPPGWRPLRWPHRRDRNLRAVGLGVYGPVVPGVSITLEKWVHGPIILGNDQPFLKGHGDSR